MALVTNDLWRVDMDVSILEETIGLNHVLNHGHYRGKFGLRVSDASPGRLAILHKSPLQNLTQRWRF